MKFKLSQIFYIITVLFILSCQQEQVKQKTYSEKPLRTFNLEKDLSHFSDKLYVSDTLKIWINRSMCTNYGLERIFLIKKKDSFTIYVENTKNLGRQPTPEWQFICRKKIEKKDKILKTIEQFFAKNKFRQTIKGNTYPVLQVFHHKQKLNYYTKGFLQDKVMFESSLDSIIFKVCPKLIKLYGSVEADPNIEIEE